MNPLERQAHDAQALRTWAREHDKPHLSALADGLEKDLSRTLTARYEASRGTTRPSEDETGAPTRAQLARSDELKLLYGGDVFIDPLYGGDVALEVWADVEGVRQPVHEEVVDTRGEPR